MDNIKIRHKNYIIRYAVKEDCKYIFELIQELAEFLNSSDKISTNVETLEKCGFEMDPPMFKCLVAEELEKNKENPSKYEEDPSKLKKLVAYALYFSNFNTWKGKEMYLEDIYIRDSCRGKGIGSVFLKQIAKDALDSGCNVLTLFVFKSNKMKKFFKTKGAVNLTEEEEFEYYEFNNNSLSNIALH